jgi:hypothetical protein
VGQTPGVTIVVLHGAGSTGLAARRLLGLTDQRDVITVEDRTGDVGDIVHRLESAVTSIEHCTEIIGVSLGAHALITWASGRVDCPPLTCVLPAWTGAPSSGAAATARAAADIARSGIHGVVASLPADPSLSDVAALVRVAWADYSDDELQSCLTTASRGHGPSERQLGSVAGGVRVLGWYGDAFHPPAVAVTWSRLIPHARIAMAARPSIRLLGQARASLRWPSRPRTRPPGAAA